MVFYLTHQGWSRNSWVILLVMVPFSMAGVFLYHWIKVRQLYDEFGILKTAPAVQGTQVTAHITAVIPAGAYVPAAAPVKAAEVDYAPSAPPPPPKVID